MRLICPSCGAQYEVDESVIPEMGRDVQCSNCGHAWFQQSAAQLRAEEAKRAAEDDVAEAESEAPLPVDEPEPEEAPDDDAEAVAEAHPEATGDDATDVGVEPQDEPEREEEAEPEPVGDTAPEPTDDAEAGEELTAAEEMTEAEPATDEDDTAVAASTDEIDEPVNEDRDPYQDAATAEPDESVAAEHDGDGPAERDEDLPPPVLRRRNLDDAVKTVLREEAEREFHARQSEGSDFESQPELGITAAVSAAVAASQDDDAADRVARVRGGEDDPDDDSLASRSSRRELLPDIEEINSTLRATSERGDEPASFDAPETMRRRRSGFRLGFSTSLLVAVLLLVVYLLAPLVSESVPALEPAMSSYVSVIDAARGWLDTQLKSLTESIKGG